MTTVFSSAARTATATKEIGTFSFAGGVFFLHISAASGTSPTLDIKLQFKDGLSGQFVDIPGASFAQKTGTGTDTLVIYPGITAAANRAVNYVLGDEVKVVATIAGTTPSFTFSLTFDEVR